MAATNLQRAHASLWVKRADASARTIRGIASTPTPDREGDIVEPMGATFRTPFPLLWQHRHDQPVGTVIEARAAPAGIFIMAKFAPEGTTETVDEAWRCVQSGLVRGLSIGFISRAHDALPSGGRAFKEIEIIETSLVTIAANAEAEILEVKRLDAALSPAQRAAGGLWAPPAYPAHLTQPERLAVLEKAARDAVTAALAGRKVGREEVAKMTMELERDIAQSWHGQRLTALEARLAALEAKP